MISIATRLSGIINWGRLGYTYCTWDRTIPPSLHIKRQRFVPSDYTSVFESVLFCSFLILSLRDGVEAAAQLIGTSKETMYHKCFKINLFIAHPKAKYFKRKFYFSCSSSYFIQGQVLSFLGVIMSSDLSGMGRGHVGVAFALSLTDAFGQEICHPSQR